MLQFNKNLLLQNNVDVSYFTCALSSSTLPGSPRFPMPPVFTCGRWGGTLLTKFESPSRYYFVYITYYYYYYMYTKKKKIKIT